jgi:hypothetical protein
MRHLITAAAMAAAPIIKVAAATIMRAGGEETIITVDMGMDMDEMAIITAGIADSTPTGLDGGAFPVQALDPLIRPARTRFLQIV